MLVKLNFYMVKEFFENILIIHDKFINNCPMHILTWEFIWITIDYFCHSSEMSRYSLSVCLNDEIIIANNNIYKFVIVNEIA
jgi:hypothetical protein